MKNKKGSVWIWILIVLTLIAIGVGIYFWLSSGNSIPQPPTFPED